MTGSMSGMSAISNKPCLNRELVAKLRSMTETIKMLSTENVALREENDQLVSGRDIRSRDGNIDNKLTINDDESYEGDDSQEVLKLRASIKSYENQISELGDKVKNLENEMEAREKQASQQPPPEKEKYKSLAKRLKEERNQYKEMVEDKKKEQDELKVEIEKMTEIIGDLRDNCGKLQEELLQVRLDSPRQCQDRGIQTTPMTRRASFGGADTTVRAKITPKRTRSTMSPAPVVPSSPRQYQMNRTNELSKPKIRNNNNNSSSVPNSPARGPRIVKPVQRSSVPSPKSCPSPKPSPIRTRSASASASSSPSKIPSMSKIPTPNKSRIPLKSSQQQQRSREEVDDNHDEMLFISEEGQTTSDDGMEVESRSSSQPRHESNTMEIESSVVHDEDDDFPPPPIAEETGDDHDDLPAPPPPADLEKLSLEAAGVHDEVDPMITTPRTLRRADSMRQRVAARRIQRTWKHFYQEVMLLLIESHKLFNLNIYSLRRRKLIFKKHKLWPILTILLVVMMLMLLLLMFKPVSSVTELEWLVWRLLVLEEEYTLLDHGWLARTARQRVRTRT